MTLSDNYIKKRTLMTIDDTFKSYNRILFWGVATAGAFLMI